MPSLAGNPGHLNLWKAVSRVSSLTQTLSCALKVPGLFLRQEEVLYKVGVFPSFGDLLSSLVSSPFCCCGKTPQPRQFIEGRVDLGIEVPGSESPSSSWWGAWQLLQAWV